MHLYIETRIDTLTGKSYKFIGNPVNTAENFADRWRETPAKEKKFYDWLAAVKQDLTDSSLQKGNHNIMERLSKSFGSDEVAAAFSNIGNKRKLMTEQGQTRFDTKLGIVAGAANIIKPHTFYGAEE